MCDALSLTTACQRADTCADMQSQVPQQYFDYKHVTAWRPSNSHARHCTKGVQHCSKKQTNLGSGKACMYLSTPPEACSCKRRQTMPIWISSIWKKNQALTCLIQAAGYAYEACMTQAGMTCPIRSNSHVGSYTPVRSISA